MSYPVTYTPMKTVEESRQRVKALISMGLEPGSRGRQPLDLSEPLISEFPLQLGDLELEASAGPRAAVSYPIA